jgi:hypothetical protein
MSCSWDESFRTDNDDITFCKRECDSNCPVVINLEPEQSIDFFGNLSQKSEFDRNKPNSFRIGLILLDAKDLMDFDKKNNLTYKYSKCTFWSNPLKIKFNNYGYKIRT